MGVLKIAAHCWDFQMFTWPGDKYIQALSKLSNAAAADQPLQETPATTSEMDAQVVCWEKDGAGCESCLHALRCGSFDIQSAGSLSWI